MASGPEPAAAAAARPLLISIAGPSRSGKTTLAVGLCEKWGIPGQWVSQDTFFEDDKAMMLAYMNNAPWGNWEVPEVIDWDKFREAIDAGSCKVPALDGHSVTISEGFLIYTPPLVHRFDKAIFVWCDKATCEERRRGTTNVPETYFDDYIWPYFVRYNHYLAQWKREGVKNTNLAQLGGDLLVLDGAHTDIPTLVDQAAKFILDDPSLVRDLEKEQRLLDMIEEEYKALIAKESEGK